VFFSKNIEFPPGLTQHREWFAERLGKSRKPGTDYKHTKYFLNNFKKFQRQRQLALLIMRMRA
jgi:hypothetical protein